MAAMQVVMRCAVGLRLTVLRLRRVACAFFVCSQRGDLCQVPSVRQRVGHGLCRQLHQTLVSALHRPDLSLSRSASQTFCGTSMRGKRNTRDIKFEILGLNSSLSMAMPSQDEDDFF